MNILSTAIKTYQEKNYVKALELFEKAGTIYGTKVVDANIQLCKKAILIDRPTNVLIIEKTQSYINTYFDEIYLVNLKFETKRRLTVALHLKKNNIKFTVHEATNGYDGEPLQTYQKYCQRNLGDLNRFTEFKEFEIKRGKPFIESAGAIGYIYTYLSILSEAKRKNQKRILILEDDVILDNEFHEKFFQFIQSVPDDWKILQLGASQYNWNSVNHDDSLRVGYYSPRRIDTCGSFAIALDHTIFDELIEAESAFESPFDLLAMGEIYERHVGKCFVCYPNIVMPDVGSSVIRGSRNQHTHAVKMRWLIENFQYPLAPPSIAIFIHNQYNIKYFDRFENQENLPFQLRIYLNTEDGSRPVHNSDIFSKQNYQTVKLPPEVTLPQTDFVAKITSQTAISESEIIDYLESNLLEIANRTSIQPLKFKVEKEIKGRVSIIIPTYKRPSNLAKAIQSVISQQYDDKEIIIVNDNGENSEFNNETLLIIDAIRTQSPGISIKLISHKYNRNGAAARNTGLLKSTGEYICFLDDDDIYLANRIGLTVDRLKELPATVGAVYCGFLGWNSPKNDENRYKAGNLTKDLLLLNYKNHYLHTNTATYRRNALLELNGFDETYRRHQDLEMNLRFFEKFTIEYVNESGVRLNPEPSVISNKIFNVDMIELKQKFLDQFANTVQKFDEETQRTIYTRQWEEVKRYTTDLDATNRYFESQLANGPLQVLLLLSGNQEKKSQ